MLSQFWVTSLRDAPNAGLFVVFYERTRHLLQKSEALPPAAVDSLSALLGASAATLATSPFDMIKTQRWAASPSSSPLSPRLMHSLIFLALRHTAAHNTDNCDHRNSPRRGCVRKRSTGNAASWASSQARRSACSERVAAVR